MKAFLAGVVLFTTVLAAHAQSTSPNELESQIRRGLTTRPDQTDFYIRSEKPNEIRRNGISYEGILVQLAKTDDRIQLINPAAPAEYGSSDDNVVRDVNGEPRGLKLFSIRF